MSWLQPEDLFFWPVQLAVRYMTLLALLTFSFHSLSCEFLFRDSLRLVILFPIPDDLDAINWLVQSSELMIQFRSSSNPVLKSNTKWGHAHLKLTTNQT